MPRGKNAMRRVSRGALIATNGELRKQVRQLERQCEKLEQPQHELARQIVIITTALRQLRAAPTDAAADHIYKLLQLVNITEESLADINTTAVTTELASWGAAVTETHSGQAAEIKRLRTIIEKEATWLAEEAKLASNPDAVNILMTRSERLRELISDEGRIAKYLRGTTV